MCYEFSHWFTKARSAEAAKKPLPQTRQVAKPPAPAPQAQAPAEAKPAPERATAPV